MDQPPSHRGDRTFAPDFSALSPQAVLDFVEATWGLQCDGSLQTCSSYVNRVFRIGTHQGPRIIKFYRPRRWPLEAIVDEHQFMADCVAADVPVAAPIAAAGGYTGDLAIQGTIQELITDHESFYCSLYELEKGRQFDAETAADWQQLGELIGQLHRAARTGTAPNRPLCHPLHSALDNLQSLYDSGCVHGEVENAFFDLAENTLQHLGRAFSAILGPTQGDSYLRLHGDCHRGNLLFSAAATADTPLRLIDFDDMMMGPAIQDMWLLLPDRAEQCRSELSVFLDAYEDYFDFDRQQFRLVEGLRFMRLLHFQAWCAHQRHDQGFLQAFPDWGSRSFWVKELEDLQQQARFALYNLEHHPLRPVQSGGMEV